MRDAPTRLELAKTVAGDPRQTVRAKKAPPGPPPPLPEPATRRDSDAPARRELPKISLDLRSAPIHGLGGSIPPPYVEGRDLEIMGVLGEGGMGRVFLAKQHSLEREVAIKTLKDRESTGRATLLAEGAVTGFLEHPSIVPVHALGEDVTGRPVLVMKRVEGVAWNDLLADPRHPGWEALGGTPEDRRDEHLRILMQVCSAAHFAHTRGVVHRDIKPANVLIGRYGEVYLADWGVALRVGQEDPLLFCGTPAYMAPEMVLTGEVDARADVYLLGATLHEILTRSPRHVATNAFDTLQLALLSAPHEYGPDVPEELAKLANRATAARAEDRPQTAEELRREIQDYLRHEGSLALATSAAAELAKLRARLDAGSGGGQLERAHEHEAIETGVAVARFGFEQALSAWAENEPARRGLAELDALAESRRERARALERLAREHDPSFAAKPRALATAGIGLVAIALSAPVVTRGIGYVPSPEELAKVSLVPIGAAVVSVVILRRMVFRTAVNRILAGALLVLVVGIGFARGFGLAQGEPAPTMLTVDCLYGAAICAMCAFAIQPWMGAITAVLVGAAAVCAFDPPHAFFAFSATTSACWLASTLVALYRRERPPLG